MKTDTILELIRMLSLQGASGILQINTGTTDGTVTFDRGQIVDAQLGKLRGFQAINTLTSLPDATYNYDEAINPPTESRITPNERKLLKDFYGIEAGEPDQSREVPLESWPEDDLMPERVIPLGELSEDPKDVNFKSEDDQEATMVRRRTADAEPRRPAWPQEYESHLDRVSTGSDSDLVNHGSQDSFGDIACSSPDQVATAPCTDPVQAGLLTSRAKHRDLLAHQRISISSYVPILVAVLVAVLLGVAAVMLLQRFRRDDSTASLAPTTETAIQTASPAPEPTTSDPASAIPDLTGNWKVINTVQQTSYEAYQNMEVGFNLSINQNGKDFTGKGEKVSENGQSLPAKGRTAIEVRGTIDGDKIEATFVENGTLRKTNGRLVWRINKESGGLTGTFNSTAARTSGRSAATKVS